MTDFSSCAEYTARISPQVSSGAKFCYHSGIEIGNECGVVAVFE